MARWDKTSVTIQASGEKTIRYESWKNQNIIESRREAIPHANGIGTWNHTSYFVIHPDGSEEEYYSLKAAKEAAEKEGGAE